jgi:hypothetical protein
LDESAGCRKAKDWDQSISCSVLIFVILITVSLLEPGGGYLIVFLCVFFFQSKKKRVMTSVDGVSSNNGEPVPLYVWREIEREGKK